MQFFNGFLKKHQKKLRRSSCVSVEEAIDLQNDVVESKHGGDSDYEDRDGYQEMMEDRYMGTYTNVEAIHSHTMRHFERMLDASQCPLYPGCSPDNTLLDFVIKIME